MSETLPLSAVKAHLSEIVDQVAGQHDRVLVTRNGRPAAVLISPEDLDSLEETLSVLSDPDLLGRIKEGAADAKRGDVIPLSELKAQPNTK